MGQRYMYIYIALKCMIVGQRYVSCFKERECGAKICELFLKCVNLGQIYVHVGYFKVRDCRTKRCALF